MKRQGEKKKLDLTLVTNRLPQMEAGDAWCHPPVWNLRAAVLFPFPVSSLVSLPRPLALSVFLFVCPFSSPFPPQKILQHFSPRV